MPLNFPPSSGEYNFPGMVFDRIKKREKWQSEMSQGNFSVLSWVSLQYYCSKTAPFPLEIPSIFSEPRELFAVPGLFQKSPPLKRK